VKTTYCKIAIILAGLIGLATSSLATNLLSDPGFESDSTGQTSTILGWTPYGGNAYSETGATAHSGTNYFKVYQAFNGITNDTGVYQDYISGPGAVYSADGWAYTLSSDELAGGNMAWIEISFRDANANILALYRSAVITTNSLAKGTFPVSTWVDLPVTNQYDPTALVITNTTSELTAPAGTYYVRYQILFQGDPAKSAGSMYFDDLTLTQTSGAPYGNWNITWSDEFNGTSLNTNVWTFDLGNNSGWGNNELEYYTSNSANVSVSGGYLHIVAQKQSIQGFNYSSARIKTEGLFSQTYGRIEWRAQFPAGTGTWPALWMLGNNITSLGWPECGEIDVIENNGQNPSIVQGSLHSGTDESAYYDFLAGQSVTGFHTYTLDWSPTAILFYVDGHHYETQYSWGTSSGNPYPFPFNEPFFFIMNLAIGGNYIGNPSQSSINSGTTFPAVEEVDYLRVYNITSPLHISITPSGPNAVLSWPSGIVCHLQAQTNVSGNGIGTNWVNVATATNSLVVTPGSGAAFYRLQSP
jgi:beta-glucanase (GH16 family)